MDGRQQEPLPAGKREWFKRSFSRLQKPEVGNAGLCINSPFRPAIEPPCSWREDLAHPIRCDIDEGVFRFCGQALRSPSSKVRYDHVSPEVQFRLDDKNPSARTTFPFLEAVGELATKPVCRARMSRLRARMRFECAVDDLGDQILWHRLKIAVGRGSSGHFGHGGAHNNFSTEFLTRSGPFTLVPLEPSANEMHRCSLVWLVSPDDARELISLPREKLAHKIEQQSHRILGRMRVDGEIGSFPMTGLTARRLTAPRLALAGEAAHVFPPIGAQGLNLSIRDVAILAECLEGVNLRASRPLDAALTRYQHLRRGDIGLRTLGVHMMDRLLLADLLPVDFMRNAGLAALRVIGPLRRAVMREGILAGISEDPRMSLRSAFSRPFGSRRDSRAPDRVRGTGVSPYPRPKSTI